MNADALNLAEVLQRGTQGCDLAWEREEFLHSPSGLAGELVDGRLVGQQGLHRVGKLEGPLIKSLSDDTRAVLAAEIAERRPKLVESMNKQLAKKEDRLKFSLSDLLKSEWGKYAPPELTDGAAEKEPLSGSPTR